MLKHKNNMKKYIIFLLTGILFVACAEKKTGFSNISKGMTKNEVLAQVGEPTKKSDVLVAEVWTYDADDRTIVFRNGEVYQVMTSAEARIDSIESALKETSRDVTEKLRATGDTIDSAGLRLKQKITGDTVRKN